MTGGYAVETDENVPVERQIFAKNFRRARLGRSMSQAEVSRQIGLDKSYISDIERCTANPTLNIMARLAAAVQCELCQLLCNTEAHDPVCRSRRSRSSEDAGG